MLDENRLRECAWLFFAILQIDPKFKWNSIPLKDVMPFLEKDLVRHIIESGDKSEAIFDWLAHAIFYMRGDTDDLPAIELQWDIK